MGYFEYDPDSRPSIVNPTTTLLTCIVKTQTTVYLFVYPHIMYVLIDVLDFRRVMGNSCSSSKDF